MFLKDKNNFSVTSADKLNTARTINGTSFNGSANITTSNWGTARTLTIGNSGKSVNGSGNVSWSLSEIGAAPASHTHSYLPLSGGNVTGRLNVGGRCILPPVYNYSNGILINICGAAGQTMVAIHVTGNSYGAGVPINSLFNFYDYTTDGGIINASGIHHGYNIGNMTVYRNNGRLYAWIKQPASYQTYNIEIITNGKTIDASLSDSAVHSSGNTNSITITPSQASLNGHTHNYAGSSSAGGAATTALACSGNSATATKATQDSAGQQINKTYIKGLSVSGKTITYTKGDGTTGTITTQDTNTTYSTGTASTLGLTKLYTGTGTATDGTMTQSAINTALNGKANSSHTHNSITNQDTRNVNTTPTQMPLGLSVHLKSNSTDGLNDGGTYHSTLMIKGWNDVSGGPWAQMAVTANNNLYFRSSTNDTWNAWKKVSLDGHTHNYAAASHTHNYAGSSSAGGNANAAVKLATARTINGTNFDGSGNITTANWGTARTLTIGAAGKSVNGSGNVSWTWAEMQVPRAYSASYGFGGNQNAITTAQFITLLTNAGAFSQPYWISRGSWSYASNQYINDTGCGNIHLAGCVVEVIGTSSAYTIRVTTPTTTSNGTNNAEFIYINNGADYSPGWRRQYNTKNKPTPAEIGAAAASHGNHVPTTQTADARKFLRNDNTWQSLPTASTSATGIVQLNDATNSTSTSQAATANAVKKAYDRAEQAFQTGNNVKQNLVDTLIAKGSEDVSTSNSWDEIIEMINKSNINLATPVYTVEFIAGVRYGFVLGEDDYYESVNKGIESSYAMCKVVIPPGRSGYYYMDCINYGENNFDYGFISRLNQTLPMNNDGAESPSTTVLHTFYDSSSPNVQTVKLGQLPDGGFFYVKYRKDNIADEYNDTLKFRVRLSDKDEGGAGEDLPSGEIEIFDGFKHADKIGGGYDHIASSDASYQTITDDGEFRIYAQGTSGKIDTVYAKKAINLTNYTRLEFTGFSSTPNNSTYTAEIGFYAEGDLNRKFVTYSSFPKNAASTKSISISNLNGRYVLAIRTQINSTSGSVNITIRNITIK